MRLFDQTINSLERSLQYASVNNKHISNNIANVDTPNYKAKQVSFKDVLQDAVSTSSFKTKRTRKEHVPFRSHLNEPFQVTSQKTTQYNHNRNNVDIDKEMAELAKNQIYYRSIVDRLNGKFGDIQTVIRGG